MNTKYISVYPQWHCRNGGGLFVGIRFQFPVTNYNGGLLDIMRVRMIIPEVLIYKII